MLPTTARLTTQETALWKQAAALLAHGRPWDLVHTEECLGYAFEIAASERWPPDLRRLVIPAVMLHDIGWALIPPEKHEGRGYSREESRIEHMRIGAQRAGELLRKAGYSEEETRRVATMVGEHDNPYIGKPFANPDTRHLREIDILWRLNPISFGKDVALLAIPPEDLLKRIREQFAREDVLSPTGTRLAEEMEVALLSAFEKPIIEQERRNEGTQ